MKRIILFICTNLAIIVMLGVVAQILGVDRYLTSHGLNLGRLLVFAAIMGFGGAFISLWISKPIAKWSTGARVITQPKNQNERWLVETVNKLAMRASLPNPEVAIYEGVANAFATGPSKSSSLVAVSTGLLNTMDKKEVEAVLAHEISHIANGDMVTLTLIQGVVNTFVFFLARVVGYAVDGLLRKNEESEASAPGMGYLVTVIICEIIFGLLASLIVMYFSRQREFRADAGAANLLGSVNPMIAALHKLGRLTSGDLPATMAASGITGSKSWMSLFATHPSLTERITALTLHAGTAMMK